MGMLPALHTSVYLHRRASFLNFSTSSKPICFTVNLLIRIQKSNVPSCITEYLLVKINKLQLFAMGMLRATQANLHSRASCENFFCTSSKQINLLYRSFY